ncbi:MAG: phosphoribosyl-dephospho-CoA transferase [Candidatus Methanofastidiosum methylothiophilum]|uniref:Phosphoribosyl-dephospho-CoA transferase n=1 Tax=Candidatus Methanofastidiosum methylothiophilum TaxID=1705564 RepID=A0A150JLS4_9EURY|nr:MAG: phosphoribosyl-dephospho-CoA transferase [Candidatus Methanofastidiosum methylthiophilus]OQC51649.1 MAG: phosphoribosyl-dephospho-CoA transferase [Euryarchaeota archaeon ADurb.Bin023]HNV94606.1 malonate decarboxylase holo-[acyl-carrier-protein] synthase [Methanofastidiosum sp.]KYC56533.1 MAG: phosphoribosyl-dephospho-CoA transferase [Candidatus Methanofastidiosum methylthiophilus]KYC58081.1 MAG: phosphoribosyl-dephospho-CoA transferase [Candidatus Methanofastidiosum methylthiophilus]
MIFQRHDLVFSDWKKIDTSLIQNEDFKELILKNVLPGIVRRDEIETTTGDNYYSENEKVFIGFVHPYTKDGRRLRFAASVPGNKIIKLITPYEITKYNFEERTPTLKALSQIINEYDLGVWGSTSLEIITGLPYTHEKSDLDLIVKDFDQKELIELLSTCNEVELSHGIKIDVEIHLRSGYGINLKEYASESDTLLGKGLRDVVLIDRETVEAYL